MDAREKRYLKIAKTKAKDHLRKKKTYKSKEQKKAFKIAENFRIKEWKKTLSAMDKSEAAAQLRAFKTYRSRINFIRNLIFAFSFLLFVVVLLIVVL